MESMDAAREARESPAGRAGSKSRSPAAIRRVASSSFPMDRPRDRRIPRDTRTVKRMTVPRAATGRRGRNREGPSSSAGESDRKTARYSWPPAERRIVISSAPAAAACAGRSKTTRPVSASSTRTDRFSVPREIREK
jgi:hypothetical protein